MLDHIGLTVLENEDVHGFYEELLGFNRVREFAIDEQTSRRIFGIAQEAAVVVLEKEELTLEIFVAPVKQNTTYNHLCLRVKNRESLLQTATARGYPLIKIERKDRPDTCFLKDHSGNMIEVKEQA